MAETFFHEEIIKPEHPLYLKDGRVLEEPVKARESRLYPGHISLIAERRVKRELPAAGDGIREEDQDPQSCRFCYPDVLCEESPKEREKIRVKGRSFILARTPFYYLPGHCILFPQEGIHSLAQVRENDWCELLLAGAKAMKSRPGLRFGFNAGTYLCCGGSQRHLHLQLVPMISLSPTEKMLYRSIPGGSSYRQILSAFETKGLVVDRAPGEKAFLAACWAPRFNCELIAVFSRPKHYKEMDYSEIAKLANWIHGLSVRIIIPTGGGINGYGMEVPGLPFMVRLIPRLPGAVQAFMETGAGCMVIGYLPESIPQSWLGSKGE